MGYQTSNRRAQVSGNSISLFPFLAVLLCTMGALITILLITTQQAQVSTDAIVADMLEDEENKKYEKDTQYAQDVQDSQDTHLAQDIDDLTEKTAALPTPSDDGTPLKDDLFDLAPPEAEEKGVEAEEKELSSEEMQKNLEEMQMRQRQENWRLSEMQKVQIQAEKEAQSARIALSTIQEHRNALLQQVGVMMEALKKMQNAPQEQTPKDLQAEIAAKKQKIEELKGKIEKTENSADIQNGSYAILPHEGPNGTRRYPIYIECREDGAWLMPENIRLSIDDFEGSLTMENPLESALSAKRQYLLRHGVFQESPMNEQEPYPLIIVRPEGILYLYMVRSKLQSWKSEYGYELVDGDMKIAYPPNDENLKREMVQAVAVARSRAREIAAMAPTLPQNAGGSGGIVYHPSSQGVSAVAVDRDSRLARTLQRSNAQAAAYNRAYGSNAGNGSGSGNGSASGNGSSSGNGTVSGSNTNSGNGSNFANGLEGGTGESASVAAASANDLSLWNPAVPGENSAGSSSGNASETSALGSSSGSSSGSVGSAETAGTNGTNGTNGTGGPGAQSNSGPNGIQGVVSDGATGGASGGGASSDGQMSSIAEKEGQNWALDNYRTSLTSLTRPIPMECRSDRYVLSAVPGFDPVEIPFSAPIPTVKRLANEIGTQIRQWGEAGRGVYWKPILRVRVAPDAREQFEQLKTLLQGSGLDVEEVVPAAK